ncbi:MAG: hypothetical protein SNJ74_02785 [Fimbriimonadaceae bacterium]
MSKSVRNAKNSLKFKAAAREGVLSVRVGVRKFSLPVAARLLSDGQFLFLSFPASSELYRIEGKTLQPMQPDEDATAAYTALTPSRRRTRRRGPNSAGAELPSELSAALRAIPAGYKLGYDPQTGEPRLIKKRQRRK